MLRLEDKRAAMGVINNRIELHGKEDVTAFDIPLAILLDPKELNALLGDKHAHNLLFNKPTGKGSVATPHFPKFGPRNFKELYEEAEVSLTLGVTDPIEFEEAKIKTQSLEPVLGGETELKLLVQVVPSAKHITRLLDAQKSEVKVSITSGKPSSKKNVKQENLPLEPAGASVGNGNGEGERAAAH